MSEDCERHVRHLEKVRETLEGVIVALGEERDALLEELDMYRMAAGLYGCSVRRADDGGFEIVTTRTRGAA